MRWKENSSLPAEGSEKNSPLKLQILQIFIAQISTLILNSQEISLRLVTNGPVEKEIVNMQELRGSKHCTEVSLNAKNFHR